MERVSESTYDYAMLTIPLRSMMKGHSWSRPAAGHLCLCWVRGRSLLAAIGATYRPSAGPSAGFLGLSVGMTRQMAPYFDYSRKLALASWSCSCFSKLSDGVDAPQKPQIID